MRCSRCAIGRRSLRDSWSASASRKAASTSGWGREGWWQWRRNRRERDHWERGHSDRPAADGARPPECSPSRLRGLREFAVLRDTSELGAIGHRVVHGGEAFREPTVIDENVIATIRAQIPLAPLHNRLTWWESKRRCGVPTGASGGRVRHDVSPVASAARVPVRDSGRGLSELRGATLWVSRDVALVRCQAGGKTPWPPDTDAESGDAARGKRASAAAIRNGKSIDTSMGITPLEGLIMGTRCGDLDPAIVFYLARVTGMSNDELESMLNRDSGLKGICGGNDMREILKRAQAGDDRARLAIEMCAYRIKKYIGAYYARSPAAWTRSCSPAESERECARHPGDRLSRPRPSRDSDRPRSKPGTPAGGV